jgi:hypothetical protein
MAMSRDKKTALVVWGLISSVVLATLFTGCRKGAQEGGEKAEFAVDKVYDRGPVSVHVRADKNKLSIAETLVLELEATVGEGYELQMPEVGKALTDFGIVDWDRLNDRLGEDGRVVKTSRYKLEPLLSGNFKLPALKFTFEDANNAEQKTYELETEPVDVEVTSLLGQERAELVIEDIEDVVEMPREASSVWIWIVGGGVALAAAAGVFAYTRRKRVQELVRIFRPAHEVAYERLRRLVEENLVEAGRLKEFYDRISNILRHYIEDRFKLRAPERTTEEFLNELKVSDALGSSDKEDIGEFLVHCDLVKFAKHRPTSEQIQRTFDLVKGFIERTRSDEHKIDVTDRVRREETVEVGS